MRKDTLEGYPIWVKFYNYSAFSWLVSILYLNDSDKIYSHFEGGVIALINPYDGSLSRARRISGQYVSF